LHLTVTYPICRLAFVAVVLIASGLACSDDAPKLPRIGQLWFSNPSLAGPFDLAFRDGLRELGYVDGKNVTIVARYANTDATQLPKLLDELISLPVDIIVVTPKAVQIVRQSSTTIPIICPDMGNPVRDKLVASLAHPGGNLTGGYALNTETDAKRLELMIEAVPGAKTLGVMFDGNDASLLANAIALRSLARTVGVSVRTFAVRDWIEIQASFRVIERD
jgi:putative tryptophan/tyrosine transport system substrate-binding protein